MITRCIADVAMAPVLLTHSASAQDQPKTLEELFAPLGEGAWVRIEDLRAASATVQLTPYQFQFVPAFWMAIPPASRDLPPGDKAFLAGDPQGIAVLGLFDDGGRVCSVCKVTDWIGRLVDQVGCEQTGQLGQEI